MPSANKPSKIYRYVDYNLYSIEALINKYVYFGSPKNFNDPYDCAIFPAIANPNEMQLERVREFYLTREDVPEVEKEKLKEYSLDEMKNQFLLSPGIS